MSSTGFRYGSADQPREMMRLKACARSRTTTFNDGRAGCNCLKPSRSSFPVSSRIRNKEFDDAQQVLGALHRLSTGVRRKTVSAASRSTKASPWTVPRAECPIACSHPYARLEKRSQTQQSSERRSSSATPEIGCQKVPLRLTVRGRLVVKPVSGDTASTNSRRGDANDTPALRCNGKNNGDTASDSTTTSAKEATDTLARFEFVLNICVVVTSLLWLVIN